MSMPFVSSSLSTATAAEEEEEDAAAAALLPDLAAEVPHERVLCIVVEDESAVLDSPLACRFFEEGAAAAADDARPPPPPYAATPFDAVPRESPVKSNSSIAMEAAMSLGFLGGSSSSLTTTTSSSSAAAVSWGIDFAARATEADAGKATAPTIGSWAEATSAKLLGPAAMGKKADAALTTAEKAAVPRLAT